MRLNKPTTEAGDAASGDDEPGAMRQSASTARWEPGQADEGPAPRFWSVRRVPAGLVAAALLGGSGLLLYDIVSVRADRPAAAWRREVADALASRPLDDAWVVAGAALAMALGVCLVVLATTPGLRRLLPMRQDSELMRAGIERAAAAVVLRDRALEVSGVRSVRVAVGRRRIRVAAEAHFRELDVVRTDLEAVLGDGIDELGLARRPALAVHVRRPAKR
ncbi:hypothetical protein EBN88_22980 [Streptomyces triticirhizae]|uniref:DUF6286 domain-containing protein n=2 Tax=Streptomyces triticirhizae TaxID=2483353 RepID=A0A3M2LDG3_9ACTN|nr:hypothetical protein EBN88_22980 [Streptomyces triticirhizae]